MTKIGYARVSTDIQTTDRQIEELRSAGCTVIYQDKISGSKRTRPELDKMLRDAKSGDYIYVVKIDRLGRSLIHLLTLIEEFKKREIHFVSINDKFDTSTPGGTFFFHIIGAVAEFERGLIAERVRDGLKSRRLAGVVLGRPAFSEQVQQQRINKIREFQAQGKSQEEILADLGIKKSRYYEILKQNDYHTARKN